MKNILISGYIGFDNFGDEAIFEVLSSHLLEKGYSVSVLSNKKYDKIKSFGRFDILRAILNCDILISGGGSLLQNKTSNLSLFYYLFIIVLAKIFFKKAIIFAQGIEPLRGKCARILLKYVLKSADFISVRDINSKKLLDSLNIKSNLTVDPIYSMLEKIHQKEDKKGLLVQLREVRGLEDEALDIIKEAILEKYKGEITILSLQDSYDGKICEKFLNLLKNSGAEAEIYSYKEGSWDVSQTIDLINSKKYVISTRLHGLITANALDCKSFALSYDDKVKNFANDEEISSVDIFDFTREELFNKLEKFFQSEQGAHQKKHFDWEMFDREI